MNACAFNQLIQRQPASECPQSPQIKLKNLVEHERSKLSTMAIRCTQAIDIAMGIVCTTTARVIEQLVGLRWMKVLPLQVD